MPTRTIAETIGRPLELPVVSMAPEQVGEHFGWLSGFFEDLLVASVASAARSAAPLDVVAEALSAGQLQERRANAGRART